MDGPQRNSTLAYDAEDEYRPEPLAAPVAAGWQDGSLRIGIHTSIAGEVAGALEKAHKLGCNALQIFSASPRMWSHHRAPAASRPNEAAASAFRKRRAALGLGPLAIHANYLINLASPDRVLRARSVQAFHDELVRGVALGADYLVVHPGSSRGADAGQAREWVAAGLRQAARGIRLGGLRVLLENTAGQGTSLGWRLEELKHILEACAREAAEVPVGVCLDTAHLFAAGYDLRTAAGWEATLAAVERTVGLGRVYVWHANDSKTPLGSRVDRHEHIGRGRIGLEGFRAILNHPRLREVSPETPGEGTGRVGPAFILETPIDKPGDDRRNVRTLWKLVGVEVKQARRAKDGFAAPNARRRKQRRQRKQRR